MPKNFILNSVKWLSCNLSAKVMMFVHCRLLNLHIHLRYLSYFTIIFSQFQLPRYPNSVASLSYNHVGEHLAVASSYTYKEAKEMLVIILLFVRHSFLLYHMWTIFCYYSLQVSLPLSFFFQWRGKLILLNFYSISLCWYPLIIFRVFAW